jgi:hypothetical protein
MTWGGVLARDNFHFRGGESKKGSWITYEETPSDGGSEPTAIKFYWVNLENVPPLAGEQMKCCPD